jgi:hypothetical protein
MTALTNLIKELRERKLWPVALLLIVALVAVPVLLSKKAPTNLVTPQPTGGVPYSTGTTLPAISVRTTRGTAKLAGRGRNPFTPQHVATTATTTATTSTTAVATTSTPSSGTTNVGSVNIAVGGGSGSSNSPAPVSATPTPTPAPSTPAPGTPHAKPAPAPAGLSAKQSYEVSLAITNSGGGLDTVDPLERLSVIPSLQQPLLVELGVLQGGKQVLFAVQTGAVLSGRGSCTPGPIDCEILALSPGQTEAVSRQTPTGSTPVALFAVNSIRAAEHPSVAAANQARHAASDAGRQLLANSPLSAGSLFQYDPSVGAVVDLRNLTVGGN